MKKLIIIVGVLLLSCQQRNTEIRDKDGNYEQGEIWTLPAGKVKITAYLRNPDNPDFVEFIYLNDSLGIVNTMSIYSFKYLAKQQYR